MNCLTCDLNFCMSMGHNHRSPSIENQGHSSRSRDKVRLIKYGNAVALSSILDREQFFSGYIDRFIRDGGGCISCTGWSPLRSVFRPERGLLGPVTGVLRGLGIRGQVAVGRTSLATVLDDTGRPASDPSRANALYGMLGRGVFHRGLQNEWLRTVKQVQRVHCSIHTFTLSIV